MSDIKSAREIAMEKIEKLDKATEDERLKWKHVPEGEQLASQYMKEDCNLVAELSQYQENVKKYITEGATTVLIRNISLPKNESVKKNNKRAMDGLKTLKSNKVDVENVYSQIRNLFDHYADQGEQQRKQTYQSLKADFTAKIQQAVQQQLGSLGGTKIDVERQPQFQQEWRQVQIQLDSQYLNHLDEYKRELSSVT